MILVTGGSGLLGEELIRQLLAKGYQVKALHHRTALPVYQSPNFTPVSCDILDVVGLEEAMQGVDEVYHCAGYVSFLPGDTQKLFKINVEGTANMVNAALDAGVKKFCFVSSVAALGRIRTGEVIHEKMQWSKETSNSKYGQSKYLAEMEVWRGIAEGLNAVMVNPSIILGAGDWNSGSSAIFQSAYNNFPWYTKGSTGFVDVRDVASAMISLMEHDIFSERFIISGHNANYRDVFNMMARAFGKKIPHREVTPLMSNIIWRLEKLKSMLTGKKPLVTRETTLTAMTKTEFDNSKLLKFLPGFAYRPLEHTISETCQALLTRYSLNGRH